MNKWIPVDKKKCELEGPYECSACGGHIMLDATFLDQVGLEVICPYCKQSVMCYGTDKLLTP
jgi:DNA-directed RNA polymerase subunit RPC12/RpoP